MTYQTVGPNDVCVLHTPPFKQLHWGFPQGVKKAPCPSNCSFRIFSLNDLMYLIYITSDDKCLNSLFNTLTPYSFVFLSSHFYIP